MATKTFPGTEPRAAWAQTGAARALLIGAGLGSAAVALGVLTALGGPLAGFGALIGVGVAAYVLLDLMAGLYATLPVVLQESSRKKTPVTRKGKLAK